MDARNEIDVDEFGEVALVGAVRVGVGARVMGHLTGAALRQRVMDVADLTGGVVTAAKNKDIRTLLLQAGNHSRPK